MNKLKNLLIVVLLTAVVLLGTVALGLSRRDRTTSESDADVSVEDTQEKEAAAELDCSVQLGALKVIRGEKFGILEGDDGDCEAYLKDGVYTISVSTTRKAPIVVTVPEEVPFERATLAASGGNLTAEDLEVETLYTTCERGGLQFSGCVDKTAEVEHLQGETVLQLSGDPSEFNYELSYELGHIEVGASPMPAPGGAGPLITAAARPSACTVPWAAWAFCFRKHPEVASDLDGSAQKSRAG